MRKWSTNISAYHIKNHKTDNMKQEDYYKAPPQDIFEDIKSNSIKIWQGYDDTYGYATEKINRIKDVENVRDNAWFIVAMFDGHNQSKLLSMVKPETATMILDAITT